MQFLAGLIFFNYVGCICISLIIMRIICIRLVQGLKQIVRLVRTDLCTHFHTKMKIIWSNNKIPYSIFCEDCKSYENSAGE